MKDDGAIKVKFALCNKQLSALYLLRMVKQGSRMMTGGSRRGKLVSPLWADV